MPKRSFCVIKRSLRNPDVDVYISLEDNWIDECQPDEKEKLVEFCQKRLYTFKEQALSTLRNTTQMSSSFLQTILFKKWKYVTEVDNAYVVLLCNALTKVWQEICRVGWKAFYFSWRIFSVSWIISKGFLQRVWFGLCSRYDLIFVYPPLVIISLNSPRRLLLWSVVILRTRSGNDIFDTILCNT